MVATAVSLFLLGSLSCDGGEASPREAPTTVGAQTHPGEPMDVPTQPGESSAATTTPTKPSGGFTRAELRAMLPSERALRREGHSQNYKSPLLGYVSNRDAPRLSPLPKVRPSELAAAGRMSGYERDYIDGCGGLCRPGLLNVSTEIHVFETAAQASRFITTQRDTYARLIGKSGRYGEVTSVEGFRPRALGDEALGVRSAQSVQLSATYTETFTETLVMFRVRQVLGVTSAVMLNRQAYPDARTAALARILEERIRAVLAV